jgi:hypothetical protein
VYFLAEKKKQLLGVLFLLPSLAPAHARNSRLAYAILLGPGSWRNPVGFVSLLS